MFFILGNYVYIAVYFRSAFSMPTIICLVCHNGLKHALKAFASSLGDFHMLYIVLNQISRDSNAFVKIFYAQAFEFRAIGLV